MQWIANIYFLQSHKATPRNHCKTRPGNKHDKTTHCVPKLAKGSQNVVPKSTQNPKESKPAPESLSSCAPKCPWIARWSPKVQKWRQPRMPNDTLWAPQMTTSAPQVTVTCKTHGIETTPGQQRTSANFIRKTLERNTSNRQNTQVKGLAAWTKP